MSEEFKNGEQQQGENAPVKKIVKKKRVSTFAGGTGSSGYGYGGGYGGYGYGGGYGGYGYGGGGYGSGYGSYGSYGTYGGYGPQSQPMGVEAVNRTFADYLHILYEKKMFIFVTFAIILAGIMLYTFKVEPLYESVSSIQILRDVDRPVQDGTNMRSQLIQNTEDFQTQIKLLESDEVVNYVKKQLKPEEISRLMAPYKDMISFGMKISEEAILKRNRSIVPGKMSLVVYISFMHPDKEIAARVANLYATQFIAYSRHTNSQEMLMMIDNLREKTAQQDAKVRELGVKLANYREEYKAMSLDQRVDMLQKELADITTQLVQAKQYYEQAEAEQRIIENFERENKNMWEIPRIAQNGRVASILQQKSAIDVDIAQFEKRYKAKHPKMVELYRRREQLVNEFNAAIDSAVQEIRTAYALAKKNYENLQKSLSEKTAERNELSQKAVPYEAIQREELAAKTLHLSLSDQMNKRLAEVNLIPPSAKIIDMAYPSLNPAYPNYILNSVVGVVAGLLGGIGMAFLVAFIDDRAKSAHDIESVIGIPLLGAIPRIKRLNSSEKAQVSASNADRGAAEAFRAALSGIKLSPLGKNAKVILSTSTTPSEGKSFVLSNLAFTAAMNGEKCIVIDADLRLPAVAKVLDIETDKGLISYIEGKNTLEESVIAEYFPNMDVLPCEKRVGNPTQILNSEAFIAMLQDLRTRYDKVFIDTPPIGVVSDAFSILPLVDGIVYVIKFNAVKRKVIKRYVKRLLESNIPILGAIINMVNASGAASYNTGSYYNKSYSNYYIEPPSEEVSETEEGDSDAQENPENR